MRGTWQLFTCFLVLSGLATAAMAAEALQQDAGPDGIVSVEAEHYDNKVDMGTNTWSEVATATGFTAAEGFSGGLAMLIGPDTALGGRSVNEGYVTGSPHLDFQVNFVKTGTHYVWILAWGMDGNSDSAHAGLDGLAIDTCDRMSGWNGQYRWSGTTMDGPRSTFEVDEVGIHTLNIYMREDGMSFDKIVVTTNVDYTPTGHGPGESSRGIPDYATSPTPSDSATDIPREVVLAWLPGPSAATHDVYFGTGLADVEAAGRTDPRSVLVSQGQDATTYQPPARLEFGQTYYWRVDEIAADSTVVKGNIWSFTAEPFTYRMTGITATASSSDADVTPQNTVNNSGMNADGGHAVTNTTMWVSSKEGPQPTWIQYEFDGVYKLHEMRVWNYNVIFESVLGFGFKDVTVEYSLDGIEWTTLSEVQFARAPGQDGAPAGTTVDFEGVAAQYVRLTANSNWGGLVPQFGLSEVRFYYLPVTPREPRPASGTTDVDADVVLSWRAGREAASHLVYLGTDANAVADGTAPVETVDEAGFDPGPLVLGTTYYWKVAEVNEAETPSAWEGDVWSFSTKSFVVIDNMESYDDDENRIYDTWIDGWVNSTGSQVGYDASPFAEETIIHGGKQSMPLEYNNVGTPFYSETEREFESTQDWTANGADTLALYFRGNPIRFLESAPGSITMSAGGTDIWNTADQFRFAFKSLNGDGAIVARTESIGNSDPWAKAGVMIRESLDPGSRFAAVYATVGQGVRYQARLLNLGAATSDTLIGPPPEQVALQVPIWIKIQRTGSSFNCFYSANGTAWTAMAWNPQTINMAATVYIGLAVTSHNANDMTTAEFSNITTTGGVTGAWQVQEIGVAQPSNDPAPLYVAVEDRAGKSKAIRHPDPAATTRDTWQEWQIPLSEFTSAGVNMTRVKKMSIGVGDRTNPVKGGAGLLYIDDIGFGHPATNP